MTRVKSHIASDKALFSSKSVDVFSYFTPKHVVDIHYKCLSDALLISTISETLLMSTHNIINYAFMEK